MLSMKHLLLGHPTRDQTHRQTGLTPALIIEVEFPALAKIKLSKEILTTLRRSAFTEVRAKYQGQIQ